MEENRFPKRVLYMNLGTTRLRRKPRNRWQDEVREDGRIVGGLGWQEKVHNREEWKKLLRTARNCRILHVPMEWMNEWNIEWYSIFSYMFWHFMAASARQIDVLVPAAASHISTPRKQFKWWSNGFGYVHIVINVCSTFPWFFFFGFSDHFLAMASHFLPPVTPMSCCFAAFVGIEQFGGCHPHSAISHVPHLSSMLSSSKTSFQNSLSHSSDKHPC